MKRLNVNVITLLAVLAASCIRADVSIYQNEISMHGYAASSASYAWQGGIHGEPNTNKDTVALDAAKLGLAFDYSPVTARLSVYAPSSDADNMKNLYLLEANATYKMPNESTITFGRFQSWIGYEAFDIPDQHFITAGTTERLAIIPTFHEGLRYESRSGQYTYGLAFLDSIYPAQGEFYAGNGNLSNGYAIEGRIAFKGRNLMWALSGGYQNDKENGSTDTWVADAYAEYFFPRTGTTLGGEVCVKTEEPMGFDAQGKALLNNRTTSCFGLATIRQKMSAKDTLSFRFSMGHQKVAIRKGQAAYDDGSPVHHGGTKVLFAKFSMGFTHSISANLDFRGEASYTDYTNTRQGDGQIANESFLGVQLVLKL